MRTVLFPAFGVVAIIAILAVSACGEERALVQGREGGALCTSCHGGQDNATGAPPVAPNGDATGPGVGAHTVHIDAGVACGSCHVVPTSLAAHPSGGRAEVTFGGLALAGGATPTYDPANYRCSGVYCHGETLNGGNGGGTNTTPAWGETFPACGSCHGLPPPNHNPGNFDCHHCHAEAIATDNQTLKAAHLNGTVDE